MQQGQIAAEARRVLDRRFRGMRATDALVVPQRGWITAIRTALGMSQRDLARRLSVSAAAIAKLEAAERAGGITLGTLYHVAEALDCTVVYALVPRTSLQDTVDREAASAARRLIGPVATTMTLEQQSLEPDREAAVVHAVAADLIARDRVWR